MIEMKGVQVMYYKINLNQERDTNGRLIMYHILWHYILLLYKLQR
jgi:hypothetical protein